MIQPAASTAYKGSQGVVVFRYHDPAKAAGPLPEPALLSARRMASRAAVPVTVNLYDPETGQGSVWYSGDVLTKLAEGMLPEGAWKEICAQKAAEAYDEWLTSYGTLAERFEMLRATLKGKLADYDVAVAELRRKERAGADVTAELATWDAYAEALCDLPAQPGAPWDGGGELTPWPEEPTVSKVQEEE